MALRPSLLLIPLLLLGACQAPGLAPNTRQARPQPAKAVASPAATPSPSPEAGPAAQDYELLRAPAAGHLAVDASIKLDAYHLREKGLGSIISTGGGNIISTGGGNIISTGGGNIITTGGGNLIGHAGGNIIATGGGNIISTGGGNYRALAEPTLALGEVLAAAEMLVRVLPLDGGAPIPLGVDGEGKPVTAIYSNLSGDFRLYLPEAQKHYMIVAQVPGSTDRRHEYQFLPGTSGDTRIMDEDSNQVTRFVRSAFVARMQRLLSWNSEAGSFAEILTADNGLPPEQTALLMNLPSTQRLTATIDGAPHLKTLSAEERERLAVRLTDMLLPHADLGAATIPGSGQRVFDALLDLVRSTREAATATMRAELAAGRSPDTPWAEVLQQANAADQPAIPYAIERPSDLNDFALRHAVANPAATSSKSLARLMEAAGVPADKVALLTPASTALITKLVMVMLTNEQALDDLLGLLAEPAAP